jgi:hypothetical protein
LQVQGFRDSALDAEHGASVLLVDEHAPISIHGQQGGRVEPLHLPFGPRALYFEAGLEQTQAHEGGDAPGGFLGRIRIRGHQFHTLQEPQGAFEIAAGVHGLGGFHHGGGRYGGVGMGAVGLGETAQRAVGVTGGESGVAQFHQGFGRGGGSGEEIQHPVEFRHGLLEVAGILGFRGEDLAPQQQAWRGPPAGQIAGLELVQQGQGGFGLPRGPGLVLGHLQERLGRVIASRGRLDELVPGVHGLLIGLRLIGPFAAAVEALREIRTLGLGREDGRESQDESGAAERRHRRLGEE